ncbi:uncharacterized protein LOC143876751 isoform X2 [Tasmannia lanceolata]
MSNPNAIPLKTAARKLPIKRKTPETPHNLIPKIEDPADVDEDLPVDYDDEEDQDLAEDDLKPPPFKYHRIWTESDEIRFLQGLLDSSADGLVFPRDLIHFYERFSQSMSQPYTKSQLSEKLRRLRKKFRVLAARLSRGLDSALLTPHDRALFHLSKQLWHPSFAASSPFTPHTKKKPSRVRVSPPPPSPSPPPPPPALDRDQDLNNLGSDLGREESLPRSGVIGRDAARAVMDVFDDSLKEVRTVLIRRGLLYPDHKASGTGQVDLTKRWREQRVAELDVLARRLS